jgi:short-subunit dehydrogenase
MEGRRVLLTGASSGIGEELARVLASEGAVLALAARSEERLRRLAVEIAETGAPEPVVLPADLGQHGEAERVADEALEQLGQVDVLINNAGGGLHGLQWVAGDGDEARELFETNLWSPLALIRRLVPPMRERRSGTVVNVTSMVQVSPFPALGHYCSSKAALGSATQTLRLELRGSGVRVIEVPFGVIDTPGSFENRTLPGAEKWLDSGPAGTVEGAAGAIVAALKGKRERVIYPRWVALGYVFPSLARRHAARLAKHVDLDAQILRRTGSTGDERQRAARAEWDRRSRGRRRPRRFARPGRGRRKDAAAAEPRARSSGRP